METLDKELVRDAEFIRYAAATCGIPGILHGKYEAIHAGAKLTLDLSQLETPSKKKVPLLVVGLGAVHVRVEPVDIATEALEPLRPKREQRLFEGTVERSVRPDMAVGDTVVGLSSRNCDVLLASTTNEENKQYLLRTFTDNFRRWTTS